MKHSILSICITIGVFFLSLFLYTKFVGPIPFAIQQTTVNKTDLFTVTGTGKVSVTPDIASVTAGVRAQGNTVKQAQDDMNKAINTVTDAIKKLGIDGKDIKTTNYNINPTYDYTNSKQRITGYTASSNLEIKIKNMEKANTVIDAATANGANSVSGIQFDVADKSKAEKEARELAVTEAKEKAKNASQIGGFTLGRIINYQENFNGTVPRPMYAAMEKSIGMGAADSAPTTQVESGSQEVSVTVTLSYEIK
jgi:uncharacterized protein